MYKYSGVHQWVYWFIIFNFHWLIAYSYYGKIIQAGMDIRRFLLQTSAQCRISCKVRQGFSGLYPSRPWRRHSSIGQIIPVFGCPHGKKAFFLYPFWTSLDSAYTFYLWSFIMQHCERTCLLFHSNLITARARLFCLPKAFSLPE